MSGQNFRWDLWVCALLFSLSFAGNVYAVDTDMDGLSNEVDTDDDNDGILDALECPAVDSGVDGSLNDLTFNIESADPTQIGGAHTLLSVTIANSGSALLDGVYDDLILPDAYSSNFPNLTAIHQVSESKGSSSVGDLFGDGKATYDPGVLDAFQSSELSHYQETDGNDYSSASYTLSYNSPINSTAGVFITMIERGGNNDMTIEAFDDSGDLLGSVTAIKNVDYIDTGHQSNNSTQNIHFALFPLDDLAPAGLQISSIRVSFGAAATSDGPDGKVFFYTDFERFPVDCDADDDGIPNQLDLDSDDDGINDVIEAGGIDSNADGKADGAIDGNGIPAGAGSGYPADQYDVDGDDIPNFLEANLESIVRIQIKGLLQGAYDITTGLMRDDLRSKNLIPPMQPFGAAGGALSYNGTEAVTSTLLDEEGVGAPIDWVLVELRSAINNTQRVAAHAGLIQRDGTVIDAQTGQSVLRFHNVAAGQYYVTLRHRNHLGVMSADALNLGTNPQFLDFSVPATSVLGDNARLESSGVALLWAGDANASNSVVGNGPGNDPDIVLVDVLGSPDNNPSLNGNYRLPGYAVTDFNMDGFSIFAGPENDVDLVKSNVLLYPQNATLSANFVVRGRMPEHYE